MDDLTGPQFLMLAYAVFVCGWAAGAAVGFTQGMNFMRERKWMI